MKPTLRKSVPVALSGLVLGLGAGAASAAAPTPTWTMPVTGTAEHIHVFADGAAAVSGRFKGTQQFGAASLTSLGGDDRYVAWLDDNGAVTSAFSGGGAQTENPGGFDGLPGGDVLVGGSASRGGSTWGSLSLPDTGTFIGPGFVAKADPSAGWQWVDEYAKNSTSTGFVLGLDALADGGSFIAGSFRSTGTWGSGAAQITHTVVGEAGYVAKLRPNGDPEWVTPIAPTLNTKNVRLEDVAALSDGSSVAGGFFTGDMTINGQTYSTAGQYDAFLVKLDATGAIQWVQVFGDTSFDTVEAISIRGDGTAVATGKFAGTVSPGGAIALTSAGDSDAFVAEFNLSDGSFTWAEAYGGTGGDTGQDVVARSDGSTYAFGTFATSTPVTIGPDTVNTGGPVVWKIDPNRSAEWAATAGQSNETNDGALAVNDAGDLTVATTRANHVGGGNFVFTGTVSRLQVGALAPPAPAPSDPAPATPAPATPAPAAATSAPATATTPTSNGVTTFLKEMEVFTPRLLSRKDQVRVVTRMQYDSVGRYTFIFLDKDTGNRVPQVQGSRLGKRTLDRQYSAPVIINDDPYRKMVLSTYFLKKRFPKNSEDLRLRIVLQRPDGSLAEVRMLPDGTLETTS